MPFVVLVEAWMESPTPKEAFMRVMVLVKATTESENESSPAEWQDEMFEQMGKYNEELVKEAIEWAKRCPNPMSGPSDLEIRPLYESEDFPPKIAAKDNALREQIAKGTR